MRSYVLYDERACTGSTENAAVLSTAKDDAEAREDARMFGCNSACFSYEVTEENGERVGGDERWEWSYLNDKFVNIAGALKRL